jgi:G:T-mismatch repair DNA endonuclease (very short patch repair protein)
MSDFLLPTQKNDFWNQYENKNNNVQNQNTQTDYWQNQSQKTMEQKQAQLDNRERYGVNVPDE